MAVEWLAATLLGIKHHEDIKKFFTAGFRWAFGEKTTIAFTGMQGAGKTILFDHLTGEALKPGYQPPLQSEKPERGVAIVGKKKMKVVVVPGQDANPRHVALDELFTGKYPVDGVVHVVANGFATVRTPGAIQTLIQTLKINTLPKFRADQKAKELKDLQETCAAIRDSHRRHHAPKWMVIAVHKYDLYADKADDARRYYEMNSEFTQVLNDLRDQVGSDYFRWMAVPVCCLLEDFTWHKTPVNTQFSAKERDAFLLQFGRELANFCK
jgi:hypothetical protein